MIKQILDESEISGVNSPLLARVFVALKYKSGSVNAWRQVNDNGDTTALISSVDGNFTLITTPNKDCDEIKEFLGFCGCNSVVSDVPLSESAKSYSLYKFCGNEETESTQEFTSLGKDSTMNDYKKFHSLLFPYEQSDFNFWYYDFSKKIVGNDAKAIGLKQDDILVSIATTPLVYKGAAIISGVYTLKDFRNKGYSKLTIYKLIEELKKDNVTEIYLWCERSLEDFYNKLGFEKSGNVYLETEF